MNSRPLLWVLLAVPALWPAWRWGSGALAYGEVVSRSRVWSSLLLIPTTAITPMRLLFPQQRWPTWLIERRGDLGAAAFACAGAHAATDVIVQDDLRVILQDARQSWLLAGWAALLIFLTFAASTDNDAVLHILRQS